MQLYPWQSECLNRWEENGYRGIVHVITGAGKTMAAMAAMDRLEKKLSAEGKTLRVCVIVPTFVIVPKQGNTQNPCEAA